jgi:molybdopterin-guanine dinucleotide biosynthesis protein A
MDNRPHFDVGGYILAGGRSSRMGRDKALLELAGRPLAWHAVTKLRRVCADVHVLSSRPELEVYAPLVQDLHAGCGPLGGIEAALEHSRHRWNLFMPVDMPFLPSAFLNDWITSVTQSEKDGRRLALFTVSGKPQPLLCLLHRDVTQFVRTAMEQEKYKVFPVLEEAGRELAERQGKPFDSVLLNPHWDDDLEFRATAGDTAAQQAAKNLWFANLNTPEEFAVAERNLSVLDTLTADDDLR